MIGREEKLPSVLRLLCLLSLVSNGLKPKVLSALEQELLHAYGYDKIALTLAALQHVGLIKRQEGRLTSNPWSALKKARSRTVRAHRTARCRRASRRAARSRAPARDAAP